MRGYSKLSQLERAVLRRENAKYSTALEAVHASQWPDRHPQEKSNRIAVWRSRHFLVQVFMETDAIRLSVNRTDVDGEGRWRDGITWDELQKIKCAVGYGPWMALEFYPPDEDVVNVANIRHLWIPKTTQIPAYWTKHFEARATSSSPDASPQASRSSSLFRSWRDWFAQAFRPGNRDDAPSP